MREIARAAGLSPMAIYRHFPDKSALVDALMQDGFAAWESLACAIPCEDPLQWLEALLEAYRDFALADPHRFDAAFFLRASTARQYPHDMEEGRSVVVGMMMDRVARAQAEGRLVQAPTVDVALTLAAVAQGIVSMHRAGRFPSDAAFTEIYRRTVQRVLSGLKQGAAGAGSEMP